MLTIKSTPFFAFCAVIIAFTACKKENKNPEWDVEVLAPIFKTSLTVNHILADSITQISPDGHVSIIYTTSAYNPPVDSLFQFHDTLIASSLVIPIPVRLNPGQPFYSAPNTVSLSIPNGIKLKYAIIKKGYAHFIARNNLQAKVHYTFDIPLATLGSNHLHVEQDVNAAPPNGVTVYDGLIDISGYSIVLTGPNGNLFNTISYNLTANTVATCNCSADTITVAANDTLYNVQSGFKDLTPLYGKGYLGQGSVAVTNQTKDVNFTKLITGGTILLDSLKATMTIKNSVGADAQAIISQFQSINDRTGVTYNLTAPQIINHTININRASETAPPIAPINSTYYYVEMDQTNSDIIPFIENLPSRINYSLNISFNPLGNVSGYNDFVYTDSLFAANLKLEMPLRFAANQLTFIDTVTSAIKDTASFSNAGSGEFTIIAENGFPWQMTLQLNVLDSLNVITDVLLVPGTIDAAPLNSSFRATTKQRSELKFSVDAARKNRILNAKRMIVAGKFSTSAYATALQVYSDYELDLKLIGDVVYHIR